MKLKKWFGLSVLILTLVACSKKDDNNGGSGTTDDDGGTQPSSYIVAIEVGPAGFNVQYEYYDNDLLQTWTTSYTSTTGYELTFNYNDDNSILSVNYIDSDDFEDVMSYQYDFEGHLIGYVGNTESVSLDWNGNIVTATGTIEGDANASAMMELDAQGRVVKFTEATQYTTLVYDGNGNITNIFRFDLDDNLLDEFAILYDSNPNPFYGQMQSVYLERFIEFFWEFDGVYYPGIEGYSFPYHKNNIIGVEKNGTGQVSFGIAYDNNDYPVIFNETSQGELFQYELVYY